MALPHGAHPEAVVAAGLKVVDVEGGGGASVDLPGERERVRMMRGGQKKKMNTLKYHDIAVTQCMDIKKKSM